LNIDLSSFEHMDNNEKVMKITLDYYVILNKIYLNNYSDKITGMIMSYKIKNNYIKNIKIIFYMTKINNKLKY